MLSSCLSISLQLLLLSLISCSGKRSPVELTLSNWDQYVNKAEGKIFIKFYAPWCGHCKNLAPTWEQLSTELENSNVVVAKFDCTAEVNRPRCSEFNVQGYPTLRLIENRKIIGYEGDRSLQSLKTFALDTNPQVPLADAGSLEPRPQDPKASEAPTKKWSDNSDVIELRDVSFSRALDGAWLIDFYADWCGFCQKLIPVYEEVATKLKGKVNVARVDSNKVSIALKEAFGVSSIPQLRLIRGGQVYNLTYTGQSASEIVQFAEHTWLRAKSDPLPGYIVQLGQALKNPPTTQTPPKPLTVVASASDSGFAFGNIYFTNQEAVMGAVAALILFVLGFVVGRATASSSSSPSAAAVRAASTKSAKKDS